MYYSSTAEAIQEVDTNSKEYQRGYMNAIRQRNKRETERRKKKAYFIKQRAAGILLIIVAALTVPIMDGDATAAVVLIPLGLILIFTHEMCIDNDYYREVQERK